MSILSSSSLSKTFVSPTNRSGTPTMEARLMSLEDQLSQNFLFIIQNRERIPKFASSKEAETELRRLHLQLKRPKEILNHNQEQINESIANIEKQNAVLKEESDRINNLKKIANDVQKRDEQKFNTQRIQLQNKKGKLTNLQRKVSQIVLENESAQLTVSQFQKQAEILQKKLESLLIEKDRIEKENKKINDILLNNYNEVEQVKKDEKFISSLEKENKEKRYQKTKKEQEYQTKQQKIKAKQNSISRMLKQLQDLDQKLEDYTETIPNYVESVQNQTIIESNDVEPEKEDILNSSDYSISDQKLSSSPTSNLTHEEEKEMTDSSIKKEKSNSQNFESGSPLNLSNNKRNKENFKEKEIDSEEEDSIDLTFKPLLKMTNQFKTEIPNRLVPKINLLNKKPQQIKKNSSSLDFNQTIKENALKVLSIPYNHADEIEQEITNKIQQILRLDDRNELLSSNSD